MLKHGHLLGGKTTPTYNSWLCIKQRCLNKNNHHWSVYGGRGIGIEESWLVFENFLKDMGERPKDTTIDRIDNNKGYSKDNCKWSTIYEQQINHRVRKDNKTGERNIMWYKPYKQYQVQVRRNHKRKTVGYFKDIQTAIEARDNYIKGLSNAN